MATVEQQTGQRVFSIITLTPQPWDPGGMAERLTSYPPGVVVPTENTWLGSFDAGDVIPVAMPKPSGPVNVNCGVPLGKLIDGGLYLGQVSDLTMS